MNLINFGVICVMILMMLLQLHLSPATKKSSGILYGQN